MARSRSLFMFKVIGQRSRSNLDLDYFQLWQPCEHSTLYIPWLFLTNFGIQLAYGKVKGQQSRSKFDFSYIDNLFNTTLYILWLILTVFRVCGSVGYVNLLAKFFYSMHKSILWYHPTFTYMAVVSCGVGVPSTLRSPQLENISFNSYETS